MSTRSVALDTLRPEFGRLCWQQERVQRGLIGCFVPLRTSRSNSQIFPLPVHKVL